MIGFAIVLPAAAVLRAQPRREPEDDRRGSSRRSRWRSCSRRRSGAGCPTATAAVPRCSIGLLGVGGGVRRSSGCANSVWLLFLSRIIQGAGRRHHRRGAGVRGRLDPAGAAARGRSGWLSAATVARRHDRSGDRIAGRALGPRGAGVRGGRALPGQRGLRLALPAREPQAGRSLPTPEAGLARGVAGVPQPQGPPWPGSSGSTPSGCSPSPD